MDGKHKLVIHDINQVAFIGRKTRKKEFFPLAQCEVITEIKVDGVATSRSIVGELAIPRHLNQVTPGEYLAEFEIGRNRFGRFEGQIVALHKYGDPAAKVTQVSKRKLKIVDFKQDDRADFQGEFRTLAACIMTFDQVTETGTQSKTLVGMLDMPKHLLETPVGFYHPDFDIAIDYRGQIGASLSKLHPIGATAPRSAGNALSKAPA